MRTAAGHVDAVLLCPADDALVVADAERGLFVEREPMPTLNPKMSPGATSPRNSFSPITGAAEIVALEIV